MNRPLPHDSAAEPVLTAFAEAFGGTPDGVWQAPGRVNLIGEHTDYNDGFVLPFAIDRAARVAVRKRPDRTIRLVSTFGDGGTVELEADRLSREDAEGWAVYPAGVVWALGEAGVAVPGFDLALDSTVPVGSGLSSSHAVECAVATALAEMAAGADPAGYRPSATELVLITQRAENEFVGAPTGIMDQSASLRGAAGHAVFLDCRDQHAELIPFDAAEAGLTVVVVDTKVAHSHADGGYASRRAACELGAEVLGVSALRDVAPEDLAEARALLDEETFRRVRHVVTENERVLRTVDALRTAGPAAVGSLLDASHASLRDDFEVSCPELDLAVASARAAGAIGARMTGGGFGGSAIALVPTTAEGTVRAAVTSAFARAGFPVPEIFSVAPADGARRIL